MERWETETLENCLSAIIDYRGKTPTKTSSGVPLITAKIVKNGRIETPNEFIAEKDYASWMTRGFPKIGDVILTTEAPLGEVAQITDERIALAQRIILLRGKENLLDNSYLKYFLVSEIGQSQLVSRSTGTTVLGIKQSELRKVKVTFPKFSEQKAIAKILLSLDNKIDLNRRINSNLEAIAQALFKAWFGDFEPVRANVENRPSESASPEIAKLFPSEFENGIPKGWQIGTIGKNFKLTMGQSPSGETYNENGEGIVFFQGRTDFGFRYPSPRIYCNQPTRLAEEGDALVSVRAPVGDVNMAFEKSCIGRGVAALRHNSGSRSFTYYSVKNLEENLKKFDSEGTVFGSINKNSFQAIETIEPDAKIIESFENTVGSFDSKIKENSKEIIYLTELRDSLLPRLISGKIPVAELEDMEDGTE